MLKEKLTRLFGVFCDHSRHQAANAQACDSVFSGYSVCRIELAEAKNGAAPDCGLLNINRLR